jgi:hypothetical protein
MKYKGYINFRVIDGEQALFRNIDVPLANFQVQGGATRVIDLAATDDISLVAEFKEAQSYKNLVLYLPPTRDHKNIKAALDLAAIAKEGWDFVLSIVIERFSSGKLLEGFLLGINQAVLKTAPRIVGGNLLLMEVGFDHSRLHQGKVTHHFIKTSESKEI